MLPLCVAAGCQTSILRVGYDSDVGNSNDKIIALKLKEFRIGDTFEKDPAPSPHVWVVSRHMYRICCSSRLGTCDHLSKSKINISKEINREIFGGVPDHDQHRPLLLQQHRAGEQEGGGE